MLRCLHGSAGICSFPVRIWNIPGYSARGFFACHFVINVLNCMTCVYRMVLRFG